MRTDTHLLLGALLYPALRDAHGPILDRGRFLAGCVSPDHSTLFLRHPHFPSLSFGFTRRAMKRVVSRGFEEEKRNRKQSERLGIVLHYVADFFTSCHNLTPNPLRAHLAYEDELHREATRALDESSVRRRLLELRSSFAARLKPAEALVLLHRSYDPTRRDPARDLAAILDACILVADGVLARGALRGSLRGSLRGAARLETPA